MNSDFFSELIQEILRKKPSKIEINKIKTKLCKKHSRKEIPTDIQILLHAKKSQLASLKKLIITKPTRTISGVAVCAVMTKPRKCPHGKCAMCPGGPDSSFGTVPQSYTGKEPATLRGIRNKYDPYLQVMNRLEQYVVLGHAPEKLELIIMGGNFNSAGKDYQDKFIKYSLKAMNDFSKLFFKGLLLDIKTFKDFFELPGDITDKKRTGRIHKKLLSMKKHGETLLEKIQKQNETSKIKCVGLTIETRPDYAGKKHAEQMLRLGCTRVELGIQSVYDTALKKIKRGHTVQDSINATRNLKDLGFKINYHLMPGIPGINIEKDLEGLHRVFSDENFKPDMLKIYPCMVMKGTELYKLYKKGKFSPLSTKKAAELIAEFKKDVPEYCRIMRVQRDIPTQETIAGVDKTNLRQYIEKVMEKKGIQCNCIRCREIGRNVVQSGKTTQKIIFYPASKGEEIFISAETNNKKILGFCRMRFPSQILKKEITNKSALIRELHVFGEALAPGKKSREKKVQHTGLGKNLLLQAENIAKQHGKNKIVVISGIGAREYYRKLGYIKKGPYMIKRIRK